MVGVSKVDSVRAALARGDLLAAYDEITQARETGRPDLDYLEVLTLARLGDTAQGLRLYGEYRIDAAGDVDALSLKARLLKDQAFQGGGRPSRAKLLEACGLYSGVYRQTRSSYPAINAATLARIAGRPRLAESMARAVVRQCLAQARTDYFSLATHAEALVVLGDIEAAREVLARAIAAPDATPGARSTTVLQLQRLAAAQRAPSGIEVLLELIRPPKVAMLCGNIFMADAELEGRVRAQLDALIDRENVGFGYGALAAGSDILIAERVLAAGGELHVVLPFAEPDFLAQSVSLAGEAWVRRYQACKAAAASVTFASRMSYVGGGAQFAYGSKVTMGLTRLRARHLYSEPLLIAVVEDANARTLSSSDVRDWQAIGGRAVVVTAGPIQRPARAPQPRNAGAIGRGDYALMFMDYPGFANLDERVLPLFYEEVMARTAKVLDRYQSVVRETNSWGDAAFAVFEDASSAAAAAMDICQVFAEVDCAALGVPEGTAMRIALHYGPTYVGYDPLRRAPVHYGTEVSRAARIEPVTPSGSVYVTECFAAVLQMECADRFVCNYVGQVALAKGYGIFPLYHLTRSAAGEDAGEAQDRPARTERQPSRREQV